ncbi:MAG: VCBS repeat-containing protein, partial [Pirellulales bacterium]
MAGAAEQNTLHSFKRLQLSDQFYCEGAGYGDLNRDGVMDIIAGPYWYAGPSFTDRQEYYKPKAFDINGYSDNFFAFAHDVNKDGWNDIVIVGFPGKETWWFDNPQGKSGHWKRHLILKVTDNESPTFTDITGDGIPDLVCDSGGQIGYAEIPQDDPTKPWTFHPITPNRDYQRFTHGMGVGDVNNDGRQDVMQKEGWWEQPAPDSKAEFWDFHPVKFTDAGGAQMYAFDVDGDGDNDVVTSKAAHSYGLSWFENVAKDGDEIKFEEHGIMGSKPEQNEFGLAFSELHALALTDMDGDGVPDIVTGKRWWSHSEKSPGALDPAVVYWFRTVRDGTKVRFIPYQIDNNSGVGTQVVVGDFNGDKLPDVVIGNKKGTYVLLHSAEQVDKEKWDAAQPKPNAEKPKQTTAKPKAAGNSSAAMVEDGFPATAANGKALNLDFETGDLRNWKRVGTAFGGQPVKGDVVHARRSDSVSGHLGKYWIGTYEGDGDGLQGTLTSVPFKVTYPWATFLVGGGAHELTRVEVVLAENDKIIFQARGVDAEEMRPVAVDLRKHQGKKIYLRIVDQ